MPRDCHDRPVNAYLHGLSEIVELCDPSGCVVGRFIPLVDLSEWEPVSPDTCAEERDRRF
jgi:hypothetical protein